MKNRAHTYKKEAPNPEGCLRMYAGARRETSEKNIEKYLVDQVDKVGGVALKFTSTIADGYPDRLVLLPGGRSVWVEVKSTGEKPRRLQTIRMAALNALGHKAVWVDSRAGVDELIKEIKNERV